MQCHRLIGSRLQMSQAGRVYNSNRMSPFHESGMVSCSAATASNTNRSRIKKQPWKQRLLAALLVAGPGFTLTFVLQASSSDSDEEEAFLPVKRGAPQRSKRIEEEEEEEESPVKAPAKRAKKAPPAGDSCMSID